MLVPAKPMSYFNRSSSWDRIVSSTGVTLTGNHAGDLRFTSSPIVVSFAWTLLDNPGILVIIDSMTFSGARTVGSIICAAVLNAALHGIAAVANLLSQFLPYRSGSSRASMASEILDIYPWLTKLRTNVVAALVINS